MGMVNTLTPRSARTSPETTGPAFNEIPQRIPCFINSAADLGGTGINGLPAIDPTDNTVLNGTGAMTGERSREKLPMHVAGALNARKAGSSTWAMSRNG
jgi:hypothetical protein